MENQKQEEENIRNPISNLTSDSKIDIENDIGNEHANENQLPGTTRTRKNLGLVETLKKCNVSRTKRDELILKIDRDFYDDLSAKTISAAVQLDKGEDKNSKNSEEDEKHEMEMDGEEESPISKALRNPIVIKNIIGFLSWSSILTSRLVNKMWLTLCNVSLSKARGDNFITDVIRIRFRYCDETGAFIKDFNGLLRGEIKTLEEFNDYLTQLGDGEGGRSGFPCKNFEFKILVLNSCQIKRFFKIQGAEIRGLRLDFCRMDSLRSVNAESLTDLLMNSCPNVECLCIFKIPDHMQRNEEENPNPNPNPNPAHILNININSVNENQVGDAISKLPRFSLTRLKCLLIYTFYAEKEHKMLVRDIVLSSPALQHVDVRDLIVRNNLTSSHFDYLTSTSKSHLVRRVIVRPELKNLDILKRFAHFRPRPRLGYLKLDLDLVDCGTAEPERSISLEQFLPLASALLDSSKESLERLYMFGARGGQVSKLLKDGGISTLKNVRYVGLTCKESSTKGKGQTRLGTRTRWRWTNPLPVASFNRIFPNAVELLIDGEIETKGLIVNTDTPLLNNVNASANANADGDGEMSGRNETETEFIPQITRLCVYYAFTKDFWLNLPSLFCNVQQLFVENENLLPVLPLIWHFGKTDSCLRLKKLELKIRLKITDVPLDQLSPAFIFPGLDAAITGFPEEACLELLSMYPAILDQEMVQEIRINSSILDLKHLEELCITFWIPPNEELPQNVLTVVSGAYAFGQMRMRMKEEQEQVKVFIKTQLCPGDDQTTAATSVVTAKNQRIENILKPLKPFADIEFTIFQF